MLLLTRPERFKSWCCQLCSHLLLLLHGSGPARSGLEHPLRSHWHGLTQWGYLKLWAGAHLDRLTCTKLCMQNSILSWTNHPHTVSWRTDARVVERSYNSTLLEFTYYV